MEDDLKTRLLQCSSSELPWFPILLHSPHTRVLTDKDSSSAFEGVHSFVRAGLEFSSSESPLFAFVFLIASTIGEDWKCFPASQLLKGLRYILSCQDGSAVSQSSRLEVEYVKPSLLGLCLKDFFFCAACFVLRNSQNFSSSSSPVISSYSWSSRTSLLPVGLLFIVFYPSCLSDSYPPSDLKVYSLIALL